MNGFLLIDKHEGITSFAVVARVRRRLQVEKIGHCGILDPLATGLLILCLGKATKLAQFVSNQSKKYVAEITLGSTSTTYDRGGELTPVNFDGVITNTDVATVLRGFTGSITQMPPAYSAVKHKGRPLYDYARKSIAVEAKARTVSVESLELLEFSYPLLTLAVTCSTGTYIRSLAHDIGSQLGTGGYISQLRRISIGNCNVVQAATLDQLERSCGNNAESSATQQFLAERLISIDKMLNLPGICLSPGRADEISHGVPIRVKDIEEYDHAIAPETLVALRDRQGKLLADLADEAVIEYIRVI